MIDLLMLGVGDGGNGAILPKDKFLSDLITFGSFGLLAFLLLWAMIAIRIEEKSEELDTFTKEESNEATIQTKKDTSKLCRASTYCVIAAVGINLLFVIFAESPYQRMVDVGQKLEELPEVALSNTNKPPNENQGLSNEEVDYLKKEAEKRMDIGIGGIIGLLKGSLLHLLIITLSLLICMTGFILDIVDAVKNRKISTRNIVNAVVNVLCIFIVIPAITIAFILKGSELMWHFIAAILLLPLTLIPARDRFVH